MKKKLSLALILIALVFTTACGNNNNDASTADGDSEEPQAVKVAMFTEIDSMDPFKMTAGDTETVMDNVFDGLYDVDVKGNLVPDLALSHTVSEDGRTYVFKLKEGVKFHNGKDFTAEDVVYTYDSLAGVTSGEPLSSKFEIIENVTALGDYEVEVVLKERKNEFIYLTIKPIVPADYTEQETHPVGTGPFEFVSRKPGEQLVLKRNENYHKEDHIPQYEDLIFVRMKDRQTVVMAMQAGDIDIVPRISPQEAAQLTEFADMIQGPQNLVQVLGLNNAVAPFDKYEVRLAMNLAVDRDELIETVGEGQATKLGSSYSPALPDSYEDLSDYFPYDPEKAKELLAEAGYPDGFDMVMTVPSDYQYHMDTAEMLESQLQKVGVRATIEPIEFSTWLDRVYKDRDFQSTVVGFIGYLDPNQILIRYVSDYRSNYINFNNPKYDEALHNASTAEDKDVQIANYKEAQKILAEDAASVFLVDPDVITAVRHGYEGLQLYPIQKMNLEDVVIK